MLIKFAVKNYRGFRNRIEWDLSSPSNYEFNSYVIKDEIVKNGIIYGPNGSGKTNFGLALFDLEYHVAPLKAKKRDYYTNYIYAGDPQGLVDFEYVFKFDNQIAIYKYSKTSKGVLVNESLVVDEQEYFSRKKETFNFNPTLFPQDSKLRETLANNANNVSLINFLLMFYPLESDNAIIRIQQFANNMLWFRCLDTREFIGIETQDNGNIEEFIIKNDLVSDFSKFLAETSGQEFDFIKPNPGDTTLWYSIDGEKLLFNPTISTGTKALELLYYWMHRINDSSFVFIDEFDAFYHFRLSFNVCKKLFNLNCQLFTSSHNTYLMTNDLLRPDCNFILSNNKIKPLNKCTEKELRFGHNIEKLFRGNAFKI